MKDKKVLFLNILINKNFMFHEILLAKLCTKPPLDSIIYIYLNESRITENNIAKFQQIMIKYIYNINTKKAFFRKL